MSRRGGVRKSKGSRIFTDIQNAVYLFSTPLHFANVTLFKGHGDIVIFSSPQENASILFRQKEGFLLYVFEKSLYHNISSECIFQNRNRWSKRKILPDDPIAPIGQGFGNPYRYEGGVVGHIQILLLKFI